MSEAARSLGKRVPAEWEPQRAVWIAWPHREKTWPGCFDGIADFFRCWINRIADTVPVRVIGAEPLASHADLPHRSDVSWIAIPTNDCWIRDFGPTFVATGTSEGIAVDWQYNSWGGKYPPWDLDNAAAAKIISATDWRRDRSEICLEGGALEWDGTGRLLTTSSCLVTPTRNSGVSREAIIAELETKCGAREVVWVDGGGLVGDDTDGHIDQLARFVDPENVVVATSDDSSDANHAPLEANHRLLAEWALATSPRVNVHRLPIPPSRTIQGTRVPESYCNFLRLGPDCLLVPTFGSRRSDERALGILSDLAKEATPSVEVIGIDCSDLIWGLGALHCASLNEPLAADPR